MRVLSVGHSAAESRRTACDFVDESADAAPRIAGDEQVYAVGHRLQFDDRGVMLGADLADDLFESRVDPAADNRPAVLGAPHDVVGAAVDHVPVRPDLVHTDSI